MPSNRPRRRQKIVDAKFQLGLGLHLVGWIYLYVVVFAVAANLQALSALVFSDMADPEYVEAVHALRGFARFVVVTLALTFVFMALHAVIVTHRIAGPVYRAKMVLREMARRRFPAKVKFRDKDYLEDLAEEMTNTVVALREDQGRMRRMNAETAESARRLLAAAEAGAAASELETLAHAVLDASDQLDRHLAEPEDEAAAAAAADRVPVPEAELPAAVEIAE